MNRFLLIVLFGLIQFPIVSAVTAQDEVPSSDALSPPVRTDLAAPTVTAPSLVEDSRQTDSGPAVGAGIPTADSGAEKDSRIPANRERPDDPSNMSRPFQWKLQFTKAREMELILGALYPELAKTQFIQADTRTNKITVFATSKQRTDIERIIKKHDIAETQVTAAPAEQIPRQVEEAPNSARNVATMLFPLIAEEAKLVDEGLSVDHPKVRAIRQRIEKNRQYLQGLAGKEDAAAKAAEAKGKVQPDEAPPTASNHGRKAAEEAVERLDLQQVGEVSSETLDSFRDALSEAFDERQRTQLAEIERLTSQLQALARQVRERESRRQEIIEQRFQQLLRELPGRSAGSGSSLRTVYTLPDFKGVLYFRADWCAPCLKMDPIMEQLRNEGAEFDVIDVEKNHELLNEFEVDTLPSLVFVRPGSPRTTLRGFRTAQEIRELLDSLNAESGLENQSATPGKSLPEIEAVTRLSSVKWLEMNIGSTLVVQDDARIQSVDGYSENILRVLPDPGRQRPDRLSLEALQLGITSLHIRNEHGVERTIEIRVQSDTRPLQTALDQAIPGHSITVQPLNTNAVLLQGEVSDLKMADQAHSIAEQFFPDVLDHIEVGQSDRLSDPVLRNQGIRPAGATSETMLQQALRLATRAAAIQAELQGQAGELGELGTTHPKARQVRQKLMAELNQLKAEAKVYNDYVRLSEENARHQLELAEMDAHRGRELVNQGVVPKQEAAAAESRLLELKASVDQLNLILRQLQVVSGANSDGRPVENPEPVVEPSTNQQ